MVPQGHDPDAARFLIKPDDPARSLTKLVSQNKVATPKDVVRAAPPKTDATCFHTLLAGSGHLQARRPTLSVFASHSFYLIRTTID